MGNFLNWTGGNITGGSGGGTLAGTIIVSSSTNTSSVSGNTLFNASTIALTTGSITSLAYGGTIAFTNLPTGVINFQADGTAFVVGYLSSPTLVNQGTISKTGGTINGTSVQWAVDFQNGGTVNCQVGTLFFTGGGTLENGTINLSGAGSVQLAAGTFTIPSAATFTAPSNNGAYLNLNGGTITVSGTLAGNLTWTGGALTGGSGGGTLAGTIFVSSGPNPQSVGGNTLANAGTLYWTGGTINSVQYSNVALTNLPTGVIDLRADGTAF